LLTLVTSSQAAHADLLERSLKQERELQQLGPLKRQVETYKQSKSKATKQPSQRNLYYCSTSMHMKREA
jgi:hypothetical protein